MGAAWETGMDEQEQLEHRAYFAMQGASGAAGNKGDWRNDVTAALRSDAPLSTFFREALASAIDGDMSNFKLGIRLELHADNGKKKRNQDHFSGTIIRREWMEIGDWMASEIEKGSTRATAIIDAAKSFSSSKEKCDKALIYRDRVYNWLSTVEGDCRWKGFEKMGVCPEFYMIELYHSRDARKPRTKT
jgi:hypothetical protein